jgi:hypothetical protein
VQVPDHRARARRRLAGGEHLIGEKDPTYGELTLLPSTLKSLKVIHSHLQRAGSQRSHRRGERALEALVTRVANAVDRALLVGDGASNTVLGIVNQTGVQAMNSVGAPTVDDLHDAVGLSLSANAKANAWFMHPRDFISLRKTKDSSGSYLVQPDPIEANRFVLVGIPVHVTTQLPTDVCWHRRVEHDMSQVAVVVTRT